MAVLNVSRHTCYSPDGLQQTPPMPVRGASLAPIHVGGLGLISLRCVGMVDKDGTRWRHRFSLEWTGADKFIRSPLAVLSTHWRWVNMPAALAMAGTVLRRFPSSFFKCRWYHRLAMGGDGIEQVD